jgi:hypothetical protein
MELVVEAALHLGDHLDVMEPITLFNSLKTIAERCGDHGAAMAMMEDLAVHHLRELGFVAGFETWVASQPRVLDSIIGVATMFLSLEPQEIFSCSAYCRRRWPQLPNETAPMCCGAPMTLIEKSWRRPESEDQKPSGLAESDSELSESRRPTSLVDTAGGSRACKRYSCSYITVKHETILFPSSVALTVDSR